jgi:UDP-N-acetylglucosamine:LPS N-acetylglucosamine transferase
VLCGRSPELLRRVGAVRGARAVSWTAEVPTLLAAADVVVDSGGGATAWEALAVDRPLVLHRVIPGHGRLNAATLTEQGLSRTSGDERELVAAVRAAASGGSRGLGDAVFAAPAAADAVLALLRRSG